MPQDFVEAADLLQVRLQGVHRAVPLDLFASFLHLVDFVGGLHVLPRDLLLLLLEQQPFILRILFTIVLLMLSMCLRSCLFRPPRLASVVLCTLSDWR